MEVSLVSLNQTGQEVELSLNQPNNPSLVVSLDDSFYPHRTSDELEEQTCEGSELLFCGKAQIFAWKILIYSYYCETNYSVPLRVN